jgi:signal transduction histidine kinase
LLEIRSGSLVFKGNEC